MGYDKELTVADIDRMFYGLKYARLDRCKDAGDVTPNGVCYEWGLAGPNGAWFVLLKEPKHTKEDLRIAERYLRSQRDVVNLKKESV